MDGSNEKSAPPQVTIVEEKIKLVRRPKLPAFSLKHTEIDTEDEDKIEDSIDLSLPKDSYTAEQFNDFWNIYLKDLQKINQPAYNVMQTAVWRITVDHNIEFTFDSSVMVLEFDKLRNQFLKLIRSKMNNFHIQVETKINTSKDVKSHIKSRKEKYQDLIRKNPVIDKMRIALGLDIENEP